MRYGESRVSGRGMPRSRHLDLYNRTRRFSKRYVGNGGEVGIGGSDKSTLSWLIVRVPPAQMFGLLREEEVVDFGVFHMSVAKGGIDAAAVPPADVLFGQGVG